MLEKIKNADPSAIPTEYLAEHFQSIQILCLAKELLARVSSISNREDASKHLKEVGKLFFALNNEQEGKEYLDQLTYIRRYLNISNIARYKKDVERAINEGMKLWWSHSLYGRK